MRALRSWKSTSFKISTPAWSISFWGTVKKEGKLLKVMGPNTCRQFYNQWGASQETWGDGIRIDGRWHTELASRELTGGEQRPRCILFACIILKIGQFVLLDVWLLLGGEKGGGVPQSKAQRLASIQPPQPAWSYTCYLCYAWDVPSCCSWHSSSRFADVCWLLAAVAQPAFSCCCFVWLDSRASYAIFHHTSDTVTLSMRECTSVGALSSLPTLTAKANNPHERCTRWHMMPFLFANAAV